MAVQSNVQLVPVTLNGVAAVVPNGGALFLASLGWIPVPVIEGVDRTPTFGTTQGTIYLVGHPQPIQPLVSSGVISAILPALTADPTTHGTTVLRGGADALLPALSASITGAVLIEGDITASLPMLVANAIGNVPLRAVGVATLPAMTGAMVMTTGPRRPLRPWQECPRPVSGFTPSGRVGTLRSGSENQ